MSRKYLLFFCALLSIIISYTKATAQYYYKDIWNPQQLSKEMSVLKNQNIRTISVKSFEADGEPSGNFFCEKKIDKNYTRSETITRSDVTSQSLLSSHFNSKGLITNTNDSTETSISRTEYLYDDKDRIKAVRLFTKAGDDAGGIEELDNYVYNENGTLQKMMRLKNDIEYSTVNFKVDDKGNVTEEDEILKTGPGTKYFYYYDDKNHLTDVVHFNERAKRLLPDYMYEYNQRGQITQMITTEEGGGNYLIWKYTYNDQNLRDTERCLSKDKKLLGSIQYMYK